MLTKLFLLAFMLIGLNGCVTSSEKSEVSIIDKSIHPQNSERQSLKKSVKTPNSTETASQNTPSKKGWNAPVQGEIIKTFSKKHPGLSFHTAPGQTISAVRNGVVIDSSKESITLKHPLGFYSTYRQKLVPKVSVGDTVKKGQTIALTGADSLYFEMKKFQSRINPLNYLKPSPK